MSVKWFAEGVERITCLPWNATTGLTWARLLATLKSSGQTMPIKDSMIAATALTHDLTIATGNEGDFIKAKVRMINPFE